MVQKDFGQQEYGGTFFLRAKIGKRVAALQ